MDDDLKDKASIIKRVSARHQDAREAKLKTILKMQLDYRQYYGDQFTDIKDGRIQAIPDRDIRKIEDKFSFYMVKDNKIKPAVDTVVSRLTQRQPQLLCNPKSGGSLAEKRAKIWSDILTFYRLRKQYLRSDIEAAKWAVITGKAYKWVYPLIDEYGKTSIEILILNGFQFCGTPGVREINKMPWIIIEQYMDQSSIKDKYGVKPATITQNDGDMADAMAALTDQKMDKACLVLEYLEKPTRKTPRGGHFLISGNELLVDPRDEKRDDKFDFPYWNKRGGQDVWGTYRMQDYDYTQNLLTHWSTGLPRDVHNSQKRINQLLSQGFTYYVLTHAPKAFEDKSEPMPKDFTNNFPGLYPLRDLSKKPVWMDLPKLDAEGNAQLDKLVRAFDEQAGVHPMTMGDEPLKRMPYLAIQYITEMDMDKFKPIFDLWEESERNTGQNILNALQQYGPQPIIDILGQERQNDANTLMTDDLGDMELDVERGSSLPQSRAGQIGMGLDFLKYRGIDMSNPRDKMAFARMLDTGWSKEMIEDMVRSADFARDENERLLKPPDPDPMTGLPPVGPPTLDSTGQMVAGEPIPRIVPVNPYQNHPIHIQEHQTPLDSPEYEKIAGTIVEKAIVLHIQSHVQCMQPPPQPPGDEAPPSGPPGMTPDQGPMLPGMEGMAGMGQVEDQQNDQVGVI